MDRLLLRVTEASEVLGISRSQCYALIARGELPSIRLGASLRISRAQLERLIAEREASASRESASESLSAAR